MNEITLDMKKLFRYLAKKWPVILCFALIGAFAGGFFGYGKATAASEAEQKQHEAFVSAAQELPGYYTEELFSAREKISETEALFAESYAAAYKSFTGEADTSADESTQEAKMMFLNSYKDVLSVMSNSQRAYFDLLTKTDTESVFTEHPAVPEIEYTAPSRIQPKWIAAGVIAGVALACVCIALPYIVSKKFRSDEDVELFTGKPVLFRIKDRNDDTTKKTAVFLNQLKEKRNLSALAVVSFSETDELFEKHLAELEIISPCLNGSDTEPGPAQDLLRADAAVLLINLKKDGADRVKHVMKLCEAYNVPVLGSIATE